MATTTTTRSIIDNDNSGSTTNKIGRTSLANRTKVPLRAPDRTADRVRAVPPRNMRRVRRRQSLWYRAMPHRNGKRRRTEASARGGRHERIARRQRRRRPLRNRMGKSINSVIIIGRGRSTTRPRTMPRNTFAASEIHLRRATTTRRRRRPWLPSDWHRAPPHVLRSHCRE